MPSAADETTDAIAAALGFSKRVEKTGGYSSLFAYYETPERFLIVVPEGLGKDAAKALAYGLTWRDNRKLVLALPQENSFATQQRAAWLRDDAKPIVHTHKGGAVSRSDTAATPKQAVDRVIAQAKNDPEKELANASTAAHLRDGNAAIVALTEWATEHPLLDASHRRSYRAWHHMGQCVLKIERTKSGLRVIAGVKQSGASNESELHLQPFGTSLSPGELTFLKQAVETGIEKRAANAKPLGKPDEHWLQAFLRRYPRFAGVEEPALREVPAWRPKSEASEQFDDTDEGNARWGRGYVDLAGLDGHGDVRVVEVKVANNDDLFVILQGLDYYTWALAYADALRMRLGASRHAKISLCYLIGESPATAKRPKAAPALPRYAKAQFAALSPTVPVVLSGVTDWYQPHKDAGPGKARTVTGLN